MKHSSSKPLSIRIEIWIINTFIGVFFASGAMSQTVTPWLTTGSKTLLLQKQSSVVFGTTSTSTNSITIDPSIAYQTMDGLGFTLTEGSAEVISSLSESLQIQLLNELFNKTTGIGISAIRISIGASDLSSSDYSYNESSGDVNMMNFSLVGADQTYLIPIIKKILAINPDMKILATPWTALRWMKSNTSWIGGTLNNSYYSSYARYFVKYLDAMSAQGIKIWAITPQNEPLNQSNDPSMGMSSTEQKNFINNNLGPALLAAGYSNVKIIAYDHNCDNTTYPIDVCNNSSYVDGAVFHLYAGNISALTTVKNATNKNVYFTEQYSASTGSFSGDLGWHIKNVVIGGANNWAKAIFEWNLANNSSYGPHTSGGCTTCMGAVTINGSTIVRNVAYYIIGQASKFVQSGAARINTTSSNSNVSVTAFKNSDGTIAVITFNSASSDQNVKLTCNGKSFIYTIPTNSVASFTWSTVSTDVSESVKDNVKLIPNPAGESVSITHPDLLGETASVQLYNLSGTLVFKQSLSADNQIEHLNISSLPKGIYLAKLSGDAVSLSERLIKK
ncbi:glycoside hydrolase family 30 beta sandwich domain-containing protein [Parabacteroides sp. FAFU027]|uniref:glycoside hydrolase family 30 beta sandwich domain-containing protein n=1 Tax=Parabacteroides sp. FAFU027 TaxID=2922715 RepID=UPI001FAFD339|nr:glycoside hydrolase family 30 beta sandwich domain-containing protein [Parabacteroides sp. FAFU027]